MKYLKNYKLLLFDIDKTLIPKSREIFPEVVTMLTNLNSAGYEIGLCSGRGPASIKNLLFPLFPQSSVHILAGGSFIISNSGEVLWQETIEPESVIKLIKIIKSTNAFSIFMKPDAQYTDKKNLEDISNHPWNQIGKNLDSMTHTGVGLIYIPEPNEQIKKFVQNDQNLSYKKMISNNGHMYYDITAREVTKAKAVKNLAKILDISTKEIIGFGDSSNDLEFLQTCGFAVAMGNADENIKTIANRVIGLVDQKGLPKYIENILKGEQL